MAIAHVQSSGASSSSTVASLGVTISVTSGNLIGVGVGIYQTNDADVSMADGVDTYTKDAYGNETGHEYAAAWHTYATTTASRTITVTNTAGNKYTAIGVAEFSGVDSAVSPSTNNNATSGSGSTAITSGSVTSTEDGSLYFVATSYAGDALTQTMDGGFTEVYSYSGAVNTPIFVMFQVQSSLGALNPGITLSATRRWAACVAVFQPSGGGATTLPILVNGGLVNGGGLRRGRLVR